eukprot:Em0017g106a
MQFSQQLLLAAACVAVVHVRAFGQKNTTGALVPQGGSNSSKTGIPLLVVVMLAFPDPETAIIDGPCVLPAVELAVTHINQRGDILANHSLSFVVRDDGCNVVATAARSYLDILTHPGDGRSFLAGMIGPSCSESAILVSSLNAQAETALVNLHMAASPALKDESKFPYSFGMAGSADDYIAALTSMVSDRQWERVALIFEDNSAFYSQIATRVARDLKQQNSLSEHYSIPVRSGSIGDCITTLSMSPDPCVIFLLANSDLARRLLCFAHSEGYHSYKWLQVEITLVDLTADEVSFSYGRVVYSCSRADMHSFLNEALFLFVKLVPQSQNVPTVSGLTYEQYRAQYMESVTRTQGVYQAALQAASPPWANLLYDAIWALALSLNSTSDDLFSNGGDHQRLAADTQGKLKAVIDFSGVSGRIKFTNNTVSRIINISQVLNSIEVLIGEYDPESKMLSVGMRGRIPTCFTDHLMVVRVLFFIAAGVALTVTLISHTLTLFYWNQIHIKASDPRLSQYIFVGCYLCCLGIVVYTTAKTYMISLEQYGICCYVINYSVFIGFCLINSTICAKTWRLYRIFTHFDNPGRFVSNYTLNAFVVSSVLLMIILLVTWSVAAPYQGSLQPDGTVACVDSKQSYNIWSFVLLGYCWILILFAAVLSLATSKLPRSQQKLYRINSPALIGSPFSLLQTWWECAWHNHLHDIFTDCHRAHLSVRVGVGIWFIQTPALQLSLFRVGTELDLGSSLTAVAFFDYSTSNQQPAQTLIATILPHTPYIRINSEKQGLDHVVL